MTRIALDRLGCVAALSLVVVACAAPDDPYSRSNVARRGEVAAATAGTLGGPPAYPPSTVGALSGSSTAPVVTGTQTQMMMPVQTPVMVPVQTTPMRLSANEIIASMANNTATGAAANGSPYYAYFMANGQERFRQGDFRDTGAWRVLSDGRMCTQLPRVNNNVEQCYVLYRNGNVISFQYPDGTQGGNFSLLAGNPQGL